MPFKNADKRRQYQKKYKRKERKQKKQKKETAKQELLGVFPESEIKVKLPTVHDLLWGKPKRKEKTRGK